ncbi:MAG: amidohydrolase family protein [Arenibacterium sp.]
MNVAEQLIRDVVVPETCLADPAGFGGVATAEGRRGDLLVRDRAVSGMRAGEPSRAPRLVMPWVVEAHCHLDKCHTGARLGAVGGDLAAAIAAQLEDKVNWTAEDLRHRAGRGLAEAVANGCRLIRTHVDWGRDGAPPLAWDILGEFDGDGVRVQRAALTSAADLVEKGEDIARHIARCDGVLGLFVLDQPERRAGVRKAFELADRFGLALDFHVDEGLAEGLDGLELIADMVLETGFQAPVLCGHACSMMNRSGVELARLLDKLEQSGLFVCALPTTNLYLQGRVTGTPDRRGITRLRELHEAGVPIVVGSDNVADAFCPTGQHNPVAALDLAILGAHLDPPLARWLPAITSSAARALGQAPVFVDRAKQEDLAIVEGTLSDFIAGRAGPLRALAATSAPAVGVEGRDVG